MEKKILWTFVIIILIGILTTGLLSFSLFKVSVPIELTNKIEFELLKYNFISMFFGAVVSIGLGTRYVRRITEPIKQLAKVTKKISKGQYERRIYASTEGEIKELSESFNTMSERLESAVAELEDNNTKMESILTSMLNGVIALDNDYKIMLVNPVAEEMFGIVSEQVENMHILEVIRNEKIITVLRDLIEHSQMISREIEVQYPEPKTLSLKTNFIRLGEDPSRVIGVVIILQDITEIRRLENTRKEFVANVSHELKTPLTSIKGFLETLQSNCEMDCETRNRFLHIIEIEADRLTYLIEDLLSLSEIENKTNNLQEEKIDVEKNLKEVVNMLFELARRKNIKLELIVEHKDIFIYGNNSWFKQMLINLIENAIKYTYEGGMVAVRAKSCENSVFIEVKDTGIGIEKEHLERLFERFYRVDKSRNRDVGGTGLGLAIVKHIILSFGGKIDVESKVDVGTTISIEIPLDKNTTKE